MSGIGQPGARDRRGRGRSFSALLIGCALALGSTGAASAQEAAAALVPEPDVLAPLADEALHPGEAPLVELGPPLPPWEPIAILGQVVEPGETRRLSLVVSASLVGFDVPIPVTVTRGVKKGPTLCLTAGIHGDEVDGIEVVRRISAEIEAGETSGTLISVPIVNLSAVRRGSRYLPDRRDLNRYFPGRPNGSSASRIAFRFFENVVRRCDALVDVHTGSFHRKNLHQLRADLRSAEIFELARGLGSEIVVHSAGRRGTLRRAAAEAGVPAVTIEAGEPARLSVTEIAKGVESVRRLMHHLGMIATPPPPGATQEVYGRAQWVRAVAGGILVTEVGLGERVEAGQRLATITDPISSKQHRVEAVLGGRVIGMAFDQLVMPGFATIHIGLQPATAPEAVAGLELPDVADGAADDDEHTALDDQDLEERPEE